MDIQEPYYSLIKEERKTVEIRKLSPKWIGIKVGDTIEIRNSSDSFPVVVYRIRKYRDVLSLLKEEGLENTLPLIDNINEGCRIVNSLLGEEEIKQYGVQAIHIIRI